MAYRNLLLKRWTREDGTPSGASSRAESRTPMAEDDSDYEEDEDADFQRIQELLSKKLELLQEEGDKEENVDFSAGDRRQHTATALNKSRIQSETTTINEIIYSLGRPRTEVSTSSRELLLAQLYKLIVSKPLVVYNDENAGTKNFVDEEKVQRLVNKFVAGDYRTDVEFLYLYRSVVSLISSNIEDFGEFLSTDFMEHLEKLITDSPTSVVTNENKANLITGYVTLVLVLQNGSSSFGVDDKINWLVEIAEGYTLSAVTLRNNVESGDREHSTFITDIDLDKRLIAEAWTKVTAEVSVAVAALHGAGALLTLLERGDYLNELSEDLMLKLVPLVDNDEIRDIAKAAGRAVAVIYELYEYGDDEDDDDEEYNTNAPYYEQEQLFSIFTRLTNLSSKKVAKKSKKDFNSVFRNVLNTLEAYVNPESRQSIYKKSKEGVELISSIMGSNYIKISKFKSLSINSWFLYGRLRHLRWAFSFGLHNQLVANDSIREILKEPETEFKHTDEFDFDESKLENEQSYADYASDLIDYKHLADDRLRTKRINKERVKKLADQMNELEVGE